MSNENYILIRQRYDEVEDRNVYDSLGVYPNINLANDYAMLYRGEEGDILLVKDTEYASDVKRRAHSIFFVHRGDVIQTRISTIELISSIETSEDPNYLMGRITSSGSFALSFVIALMCKIVRYAITDKDKLANQMLNVCESWTLEESTPESTTAVYVKTADTGKDIDASVACIAFTESRGYLNYRFFDHVIDAIYLKHKGVVSKYEISSDVAKIIKSNISMRMLLKRDKPR